MREKFAAVQARNPVNFMRGGCAEEEENTAGIFTGVQQGEEIVLTEKKNRE